MRYLKLYEEYSEEKLFYKIDNKEYHSYDTLKFSDREIQTIVSLGNKFEKGSRNNTEYNDVIVQIGVGFYRLAFHKIEDNWYLCQAYHTRMKSMALRYKCDDIEGVKSVVSYFKQFDKNNNILYFTESNKSETLYHKINNWGELKEKSIPFTVSDIKLLSHVYKDLLHKKGNDETVDSVSITEGNCRFLILKNDDEWFPILVSNNRVRSNVNFYNCDTIEGIFQLINFLTGKWYDDLISNHNKLIEESVTIDDVVSCIDKGGVIYADVVKNLNVDSDTPLTPVSIDEYGTTTIDYEGNQYEVELRKINKIEC